MKFKLAPLFAAALLAAPAAGAMAQTVKLGVVLLDSPNPGKQAMQLLDRGFKASRIR